MSKPTRAQLLIEERLGRPLDRFVMNARGTELRPKNSWNQIALLLHSETGVHVTAETLRIWFYDAEKKRRQRAEARTAA
jgi:hypothetical protein